MHDYGKLTGRRLDIETHDEDGVVNGTFPVFAFYDEHGEEWHDVYKANPSEVYVAVDGQLRVVSYETDPDHSQIGGVRILGLTAIEAGNFTSGPSGTAYNTYWNGLALSTVAPTLEPLSRVNFKLGMLYLNITPDQIDAAIEQMAEPDRTFAKVYWNDSVRFHRSNPLIAQLAGQFGSTSDQIDAAWLYALQLGTE